MSLDKSFHEINAEIDTGGLLPVPPNPANQPPLYNVILHNCDCHDQQQVEFVLSHLCGLPRDVAHDKMMMVHIIGQSIIGTYHMEAAELFYARIRSVPSHTTGLPLSVTIEPA